MGLRRARRIDDIAVDRVFIGSCTNGRLADLRAAAAVFARPAASPTGVRRDGRARARMQVKAEAEAEGLDQMFTEAGFEWRDAGCSMCLAMNDDSSQPGERCASTSNRNFEGRQGKGGRTHLVSPRDGRRRGDRRPLRRRPRVLRDEARADGTLHHAPRRRGPLDRANVDTDQIIPKQFLKRIERTGFGEFLFCDWRTGDGTPADFELNQPAYAGRNASCSPAATSAAAPRASTPPGRSRTTASARSSRRASPTSSATTASRTACCRCSSRSDQVHALMDAAQGEPGARATVDLERQVAVAPDGSEFAVRIDPVARERLLNGLDDIAPHPCPRGRDHGLRGDRERGGRSPRPSPRAGARW